MDENKKAIYPVEPWNITEEIFLESTNYRNETTFCLSNGYIGTRGTFEENYDFDVNTGLEGNFINGFYESEQIRYGEWNFGFPTESQSLLNLPNGKIMQLKIEDEIFDMRQGKVSEYKRVLHMKEGTLTRSLTWTSPKGKIVEIKITRFVSFTNKNLMAIQYKVKPVNFSGNITFLSKINADVENHTRVTNPLVDYGPFGRRFIPNKIKASGDILYVEGTTLHSKLSAACGCSHTMNFTCDSMEFLEGEYECGIHFKLKAEKNQEFVLEKYMILTSSNDIKKEEMESFVSDQLQQVKKQGYQKEELLQKEYMRKLWENGDIVIDGDDSLQQGIRFNLFHIMQAAARDGKTGMGAKGLSGEGYEGHYFWDTEMYVVPVFIYTNPKLARPLLEYRYHTLNEARDRAKVLGHPNGALFPWRTINGKEASTYFPLGTAQYHINGDIAYAFKLYMEVTGDDKFLIDMGAEVLCEMARVFADVGCFAESKGGKYCICAVTGPDEYNAIVDNNFYTNLLARENLKDAIWALNKVKEIDESAYNQLRKKLNIQEKEINYWKKIIQNMYFPYDEQRKVYPLDDGFMQRKPWDDSKIPPEKRHLLYENYHPLFVYRQRMSKQADAILGMYLCSNQFTLEELKRNYDFYQEVTLHHSSLSTCIFGIVASQIGYHEEAYDYFITSARMDLDDYHNNFYAGIHAANMAGTWQAMINGFAGLRTNKGFLEFHPTIPKKWKGFCFQISYQGSTIKVNITQNRIETILMDGIGIEFFINDKKVKLNHKGEESIEKI